MKKQGFSLIEILIVLALIAVLASIAVPTYQKYTIKLHRTDGQTALLDLANRMERYYAAQQTYANATIATGNTQTDLLENDESPKGWYQLKIAEQSPSSYLLHAVPLKQQAENDILCQTLTLNHLGQKNITAGPAGQPSGDVEQCW